MRASDGPSLVAQRHLLGAELREARRDAGQTQEQAAVAMGWSRSKVVRIETGKVGVSTNDLVALIRHYRTTNQVRIVELISLERTIEHEKAENQHPEQGRRTITGPASQLPESRRARAPESELDFNDRLLAGEDS